MRFPRSTFLITLVGAAAVGACFGNQVSPSTFRNTCDSDSDCRDDEACIGGLCERPCTQATSADDCPSADGYAACMNGACATLCPLPEGNKKDPCPSPQTCVDLGIDLGGFGAGGGADTPMGVCTTQCTAESCPTGEACFEGFCVASCTVDTDCASGLVCLGGLCVPDLGGGSGSTSSTTAGGSDTGTGGTGQ